MVKTTTLILTGWSKPVYLAVKRMKFLVDRDIPIFTGTESAEWWSRFVGGGC